MSNLRRALWQLRFAMFALVIVACGGSHEAPEVPPVLTVVGATVASLASGASVTVNVTASDRTGKPVVSPVVSWQSSNATVATVTSAGLVTGVLVGNCIITATYDGVSATVQVNVIPGVATTLAIRTQPAGANVGAPFVTQPVLELRDAAGNIASGSAAVVTASLASGGGTLSGTLTTNAVNGVAVFSSLQLDGAVGNRTITFTAGGLASVTSANLALQSGAPSQLVIRTQPSGAVVANTLTVQPVVELRDASGNLSVGATLVVTASISQSANSLAGSLSATAVGGVATFNTLIVNGTVGSKTLVFSATGVAPVTSAPFTLSAGAPYSLAVRTTPTSGGLNSTFLPPAVVEVRDVSGNLAVTSSAVVNASITSGGGTLSGASATAVAGLATFSQLSVNGSAGSRTLTFTASGLISTSVTLRPCDAIRAPQVDLGVSSLTINAFASAVAVLDSLRVTDRIGSCVAPTGLQVTVTAGTGGNWLTASLVGAQSIVELRAAPTQLPTGNYTASVTLSSTNAGSVTVPVTLTIQPSFQVAYGSSDQKILQLDPGIAFRPTTTVRDNAGVLVSLPVVYQSRSPSLASVGADGAITGRADGGGPVWVVARVNAPGGLTDSVFANVTRGPGPLLRTDASRTVYDRNGSFSITVQLDTRGATIGAAQVVFTWPSSNDTPGLLRYINAVPGVIGNPVLSTDLQYGTARISIASATGMTGLITLARFDFTATVIGASQFTTRFVELIRLDQTSLVDGASALVYPVIVR